MTYCLSWVWVFPLKILCWEFLLFLILGALELLPIDALSPSIVGTRSGAGAVLVKVSGKIFLGSWSCLVGLDYGPVARNLKLELRVFSCDLSIHAGWFFLANSINAIFLNVLSRRRSTQWDTTLVVKENSYCYSIII